MKTFKAFIAEAKHPGVDFEHKSSEPTHSLIDHHILIDKWNEKFPEAHHDLKDKNYQHKRLVINGSEYHNGYVEKKSMKPIDVPDEVQRLSKRHKQPIVKSELLHLYKEPSEMQEDFDEGHVVDKPHYTLSIHHLADKSRIIVDETHFKRHPGGWSTAAPMVNNSKKKLPGLEKYKF